MSSQHFCEQCGAKLREGVKFCEGCGTPLGGNEKRREPTPAAPRPAPRETEEEPPSPTHTRSRLAWAVPLVVAAAVAGWWFVEGRHRFLAASHGTPHPAQNSPTTKPPAPEPSAPSMPVPPTPPPKPEVTSTLAGGVGNDRPPIPSSNSPAPPTSPPTVPNLVVGGDFSSGGASSVEGDGGRVEGPAAGDQTWRLVGPDDMAISFPLMPMPGTGILKVRFRVLVPVGTVVNEGLAGVLIRARLTGKDKNPAINERVLRNSDQWQPIEIEFGDEGSRPHRLWIEAVGFDGALYVDDVAVNATAAAKQPAVATPEATPPMVPAAGKKTELEEWVTRQPWFLELAQSMPAGVTLSVQEGEAEFEGWGAFEIREHHSSDSGFDPNVAPLIGLFQVSPDRSGVGWFDTVNAEWQPIEDFFASRKGR